MVHYTEVMCYSSNKE